MAIRVIYSSLHVQTPWLITSLIAVPSQRIAAFFPFVKSLSATIAPTGKVFILSSLSFLLTFRCLSSSFFLASHDGWVLPECTHLRCLFTEPLVSVPCYFMNFILSCLVLILVTATVAEPVALGILGLFFCPIIPSGTPMPPVFFS